MSAVVPPAATTGRRPTHHDDATRIWHWALEVLPAFVAALVLLPFIISTGQADPWKPATIDLDVYVAACQDLLAGKDIYATRTEGWDLPYIYPPIAAILMVPLTLLPTTLLQLVWTGLTVLAQRLVLARAGVERGFTLGMLNVALVVAFEPFRTTLGYGQVNTVLMALVVGDLLPRAVGERRWLPRGLATGLAAAVKLTPLLFLVFAFIAGRRRVAIVGAVSAAAFTLLGFLLQPAATLTYVHKVITGDTYGNPVYVGNQSLNAVFARLLGTEPGATGIGMAVAALFGLVALAAAYWAWRSGELVLAVGLVGLGTCLASPLSWTHHHVWALLVGLGGLTAARHWRRARSPEGQVEDRRRRPGLPPWITGLCLAYAGWVAMCPVLAFLPYGDSVELTYTAGQSLVGNLLPVLASVLVVLVVLHGLRVRPRSENAPGADD